jgi:hypothetical protein
MSFTSNVPYETVESIQDKCAAMVFLLLYMQAVSKMLGSIESNCDVIISLLSDCIINW